MSFGKNIIKDLRFIAACVVYPQRSKALYLGYTGYGNLGDEAVKESIFQLLEPRFLFSESQGFLVRALRKWGILKFDILVLGGGTFILNAFRWAPDLNLILEEDIPRKIVFGTGVIDPVFPEHPIEEDDVQKWVDVLNRISYLSVRGPLSARILKEKNVQSPIHIIGDPAFYFIRDIGRSRPKEKRLGINVGPTKSGKTEGVLWGRNEERFLEELTLFIELMISDGWKIGLVPVCKEDEVLMKRLCRKNHWQRKLNIFKSYNDIEKTLDHLEAFDVFVGEKLHSVALSYCSNTPAVMLEYRPKCRDFMASIDMERFNMRTDEVQALLLKDMVEDLYSDRESVRAKTNEICKTYKEDLIRASRHVASLGPDNDDETPSQHYHYNLQLRPIL